MKIDIFDEQLNRVLAIEEQFVSCLWQEGYNTVETFTLELQERDLYKRTIKVDYFVGRKDRPTLMVIKSIDVRNGKIVLSGKQAIRILDDLVFVGKVPANKTPYEALTIAYNGTRGLDNLIIPYADISVEYGHQESHKSLLELAELICQETDVGFKIVRNQNTLELILYQPTENPNLIYSKNFGNLTLTSVTLSVENLKNYAIVLGQGEGESRVRQDVDRTEGGKRLDLFVDAKDIQQEETETDEEYRERLIQRGVEKLAERTKTWECAFTPFSDDFGKRFDLGDILTVYLPDYGIKLKSRCMRFSEKEQNNQTTLTVEVGEITIVR